MTKLNFVQQLDAFKKMILDLLPKPIKNTKLYASDFKLIANINTPYVSNENSAILNNFMLIPNPYGHIVLDQVSSSQETRYYIGKIASRVFEPYCIDLVDFRGILQAEPGVVLYTEPGYAGIQINRILGDNGCQLIDISLNGQLGLWTPYRRGYIENGEVKYWNSHELPTDKVLDFIPFGQPNSYDTDWGTYKTSAINAFGQFYARNLTISNYASHGINNFGHNDVRINSTPKPFKGKLTTYNGNPGLMLDEATYREFNYGTTVIYDHNGITRRVGGYIDGKTGVTTGNWNDPKIGKDNQEVTGVYFQQGKNMLANSCVLEGINNIVFCGGGAVFTTGDNANQSTFSNIRMGNIGGPGFIDSSLLKNLIIAPHYTQTGEHFADRSVDPPIFHQPPFTNRNDNNSSTTQLHPYYESGNQGSPTMSWNSLSLGGFNEGTMTGGHGFFNRRLKDVYIGDKNGSNIEIDSQGLRWQYGDKAVIMRVNEKLELIYGDKPLNN